MALALIMLLVLAPSSPASVLGGEDGVDGVPRQPDGRPDLSGVWTTATATPLERPRALASRPTLTADEARQVELAAAARANALAEGKLAYNREWLDPGLKVLPGLPSALIVDPATGSIPWKREARAAFEAERARYGKGPFESHHDLDTGERCISDGVTLLPLQPYNMNFKLVQTANHLMIYQEMYHEVRIVPFTQDPPPAPGGQWLGDARARWEGDTLVVTTKNFADRREDHWAWLWRAPRPGLRLIERFTRVDATTIDYQVTVEDPASFMQSWTASAPMTTDQESRGVTAGKIYEYACHEANYSLLNVLRSARAEERAQE